jgi:DNA-binding CsgD family transcriptional regulator/tetratricopeptide (TPR) repeat protein
MRAQPVFCRPLIERRAELELLRDRRRGASAGHGGLVLVAGEAGVGKTRLLSEFARSLTVPRLRVVLANCREFAQRPYAPVLDLLASLDAQSDSLAPARSRDEQFEPLIRAFARESERSTIVALIEDLHWSDPATAELIAAIAESAGTQRLLLVATYRPEAIREDSAMFASLARLQRLPVTTTVELGPLDADATRRFVEATLEPTRGLPAQTRASIVRLSDGNPLFVEELLKNELEKSDSGVAAHGLPATIRAAILERLRPLAEDEREVIAHAAVVGRRFTTALLEAILSVPHERVLGALHRACALQLVTEEGTGVFAFRHALTREAIYDSFLRTQVAGFHHAIAQALEALPEDQRSIQDLAYHTRAAGDRDAAARYSERAGDEADAVFAHDDAARYYEAALASVEPRSLAAARLALKLGRTHNRNLDKRLCGAYYEQAAEAFAAAHDIEGEADARFEQTAALYSLDDDDCTRPLERFRDRLLPEHERLRTRTAVRLAHLYQLLGRGDEAGKLLETIPARELASGDWRVRATYHATRAALAAQVADVDACRLAFGDSLTAAADDVFTRHVILSNAAGTFTDLGRFDEALRYFDETEQLARTHRLKSSEAFVLATKARLWWLRGELAHARDCLMRALAIPSEYELARLEMACCAPFVGELLGDETLLTRFASAPLPRKHLGRLAAAAAERLLRAGQVEDAQALLHRALEERIDARTPFVLFLAVARIGAPADAVAARPVVERLAALDGDIVFKAALSLFDALAARRRGDGGVARTSASEAARSFGSIGCPQWEAEALEIAGRSQEAAAIYRRIGAIVPLRRIELEARSASHGTRARGTPGLTGREREVLALAGRGLSNGEIAHELTVSVKAVEKHIGSLYAKLGFASRGRLIAYVASNPETRASSP